MPVMRHRKYVINVSCDVTSRVALYSLRPSVNGCENCMPNIRDFIVSLFKVFSMPEICESEISDEIARSSSFIILLLSIERVAMGGRILIITDYKMGPSFNLLYYSVIGTLHA